MYHFYKKTEKTEENEFGLEMVDDDINPFEEPTFLSLLAINSRLRDTNGSISRILELAGVRKPNGEENLSLEETPINFLGLAYGELRDHEQFKKRSSYDNQVKTDPETIEFVDKYLMPLLVNNGQKIGIDECMKNMRNINIMCYCDAFLQVKAMNDVLIERMNDIGYSEEEIDSILSQVCVIPIGTEETTFMVCLTNLKFTTLTILDYIDTYGPYDEEKIKTYFGENKEGLFDIEYATGLPKEKINTDSKFLVALSDGDHDLTVFIKKGIAFPSIIIESINAILNNSIDNNNGNSIPLSFVMNKIIPEIGKTHLEAEQE